MHKRIVLKNNVEIYIKININPYHANVLTTVTLASTSNALPDDGVTASKRVRALLMSILT